MFYFSWNNRSNGYYLVEFSNTERYIRRAAAIIFGDEALRHSPSITYGGLCWL
jgi:hypothetical protein